MQLIQNLFLTVKNENIKKLFLFLLIGALLVSCAKKNSLNSDSGVKAPNNLKALTLYNVFTTQTPTSTDTDGPYEMGMKFQSTQAGQITKIRYYKYSGETGTHTGRLWSSTGTQLASVTFSGETSSGWQSATLGTPYSISANTTYVVSVNSVSRYGATNSGLASAVTNGPLSTIVGSNGVYGTTVGAFPTSSYQNSNYFRDIELSVTTGGTVASPSFSPGGGTYASAQSVTITTSTSGASIRYTTNGSTPTSTTGTVYSSPVSISATTTLKAITYKSGMTNSSVTTATYTIGGITATLYQEFHSWSGSTSPDGIWRIAGVWQGSGGTLDPANAIFTETYSGESSTGFLSLTQTPLVGGVESGAEVQTLTSYGYGYYECRMKVAHVSGVVASFFWIQAPDYGSLEFDHEFLTDESWLNSGSSGIDHFSTHPNIDVNYLNNVSFNPSLAFHRYGILWQAGRLDYTIDGVIVHTVTNSALNTSATGYIMINTWSSGNPDWGGGPPAQNATTVYDWIKFYPNVTSVPNGGN